VANFAEAPSFVKICGITSIGDARVTAEAGADAIGLNFTRSVRHVTVEQGREIAAAINGSILRVGIFGNDSDDFVVDVVDGSGVDAVQIHGPLSDELRDSLRARGMLIIKALSVGSQEFYEFDDARVDAVLIDGPTPGSGETHPWDDLARRRFTRRVIVAGGLNALNVVDVLETTNAWGADVASGVESTPGVKDPSRVRDFVSNARAYFDREETRD
jgi:phosphoribosylanthranilate isomerase